MFGALWLGMQCKNDVFFPIETNVTIEWLCYSDYQVVKKIVGRRDPSKIISIFKIRAYSEIKRDKKNQRNQNMDTKSVQTHDLFNQCASRIRKNIHLWLNVKDTPSHMFVSNYFHNQFFFSCTYCDSCKNCSFPSRNVFSMSL